MTDLDPVDGTYPPDLTEDEEEERAQAAAKIEAERRRQQEAFVDAPQLLARARQWMSQGRRPDGKVTALGPIPIGSAVTGGPRPATNADMLVGVTVADSIEVTPSKPGERPHWIAEFMYT